jgi:type I restriction enzyme, S subunit
LLTGKRRLPGFANATIGYKHTEVGVIPEDWEVRPAGELCKVNQGLQIAISNRLKIPSLISKKYITIQYLNEGKEVEYIDSYSLAVCCIKNDILMTRTGNTGIIITNVEGVFHNNFFKINYEKKLLTREHLVNFLRLEHTQKQIMVKAGTSTIPDLNHNDFYSIHIVLPPLPEQEAIAEVLSDMDAEIAALETKLVKARQIKQGMMQELLTGRIRLV